MISAAQVAERFRSLHRSGLLILPNAWDAGSARLVEAAGAKAIATGSAGVSWSHGVPDGQHLTREMIVATAREVVGAVRVPVSLDLEAGYGDSPEAVATVVRAVVEEGVIGVNLEDAQGPAELLARKIALAHDAAREAGTELFVNARTDVYLRGLAPPERRVEETLRRAALFRDAGADGFFVPGVTDEREIAEIASGCGLPLNVLARPNLASPARLEALGVRRLSLGPSLQLAAFGLARNLCQGLLERGDYGALFASPIPFAEMNALFAPR